MNYSFYLLSNVSQVLACLLPDSNCESSSCFADKESYVEAAAHAAGWGYDANNCPESFPNAATLCGQKDMLGDGSLSHGILRFVEELNASSVQVFTDVYCNLENGYDSQQTLEYFGAVFGVILGVCLLAASLSLYNNREHVKASCGAFVQEYCVTPSQGLAGCFAGLFANHSGSDETKPLRPGEIPNPVFDYSMA